MSNTSSWSSKVIQVSFVLAGGRQFGLTTATQGAPPTSSASGNTKVVSGLKIICHIKKAGQPAKNECKLQIYGMLPADMAQLSTLGYRPLAVRNNLIQVLAGDSDGLASVFQGEITGAWVNYHKPPDLNFEVHAVSGYYPAVAPANPISLQGAIDAAKILSMCAKQMGYSFEPTNLGIINVNNPYLTGSVVQQATTLAKSLGLEFGIDDGVFFVSRRNTPRAGAIAYTSPTAGMKDYPTFNKRGLEVEMIFNPAAKLGGLLQISGSAVAQANATWRIHGLEHNLVALSEHEGAWYTKVHSAPPGSVVPSSR